MLKLQMLKTFFLILLLSFFNFLNAKEPFLAILLNIPSNGMQTFNYGNYDFHCNAYGVITLESLHNIAKSESICKKNIEKFYKKNPDLKYFSLRKLDVKQRYHIEFKNQECVLYASGDMTLSELLLREGLSIQKPNFNDDEFRYSFFKSQLKAKTQKKGLWKENIYESCVKEIGEL